MAQQDQPARDDDEFVPPGEESRFPPQEVEASETIDSPQDSDNADAVDSADVAFSAGDDPQGTEEHAGLGSPDVKNADVVRQAFLRQAQGSDNAKQARVQVHRYGEPQEAPVKLAQPSAGTSTGEEAAGVLFVQSVEHRPVSDHPAPPPSSPAGNREYLLPFPGENDDRDAPRGPADRIFPQAPPIRSDGHEPVVGRHAVPSPAASQTGGQVAPRVLVLVTLAEARAVFEELIHEAVEQFAERIRKAAEAEVASAFWQRDAERRALLSDLPY
ncbi:MAG: hypothetical protein DWQ37_00240 [Planctomycetota bacterium]|nr:MAG: hypothetical protein DWQ37_00240 [Planctomycetota bacterium]